MYIKRETERGDIYRERQTEGIYIERGRQRGYIKRETNRGDIYIERQTAREIPTTTLRLKVLFWFVLTVIYQLKCN